jgi:cephalosporin hydroxylase
MIRLTHKFDTTLADRQSNSCEKSAHKFFISQDRTFKMPFMGRGVIK